MAQRSPDSSGASLDDTPVRGAAAECFHVVLDRTPDSAPLRASINAFLPASARVPRRLEPGTPETSTEHVALDSAWDGINDVLGHAGIPALRPVPLKVRVEVVCARGAELWQGDGAVAFAGRHARQLQSALQQLASTVAAQQQHIASQQAQIAQSHARLAEQDAALHAEQTAVTELQAREHAGRVALAEAAAQLSSARDDAAHAAAALVATTTHTHALEAQIRHAREAVVKARAEVAALVDADAARRRHNEAVFTEVTFRARHARASLDRRTLGIIDMYEQRIADINHTCRTNHTPSHGEHVSTHNAAPEQRSVGVEAVQADMTVLAAETQKAIYRADALEAALSRQQDANAALTDHCAALRLQLGARPSLAAWRETRARVHELEARLARQPTAKVVQSRSGDCIIGGRRSGTGRRPRAS